MLTTVVSHQELSPGYFRLILSPPQGTLPGSSQNTSQARAGQFYMVRVSGSTDPLLRRPFSLHDKYEDGSFSILYHVVGKGTALLGHVKEGDELDILGPLGNGFMDIRKGVRHVLVGGGIGVAPLMALSRDIRKVDASADIAVFIGGRGEGDVLCGGDFELLDGVSLSQSTEDGTCGMKGLITESLERFLAEHPAPSVIYTCGPTGMMRQVARIAGENATQCFVSMEERMGCGMGACLGCVVPVRPDVRHVEGEDFVYKRACIEGPVFNAEEIFWGAK